MASFNRVLLMGNLTKDPELRYTPGGSAVTDFGLAINRSYNTSSGEKKEETCFVEITVWGKQAESVTKYLHKGSSAFVEGRLQLDQWEDKETGKNRSRLKVVAERVQFLGGSKDGGGDSSNYPNNSGTETQGGYSAPASAAPQPYQQTAAPNVPPPMPSPPTAPVAAAPAPAPAAAPVAPALSAPQQPAAAPTATAPAATAPTAAATQQPAVASQPQSGAFNTGTEAEDDIPF